MIFVRSVLLGDGGQFLPASIRSAIEAGRIGLLHTSSVPEPTSGSTERKYNVHIKYGRNGQTPIYAEQAAESTREAPSVESSAQWNYWRILSDLHAGVTFVAVYGMDIKRHTELEYTAAFDFGNRYAGYLRRDTRRLSPGAWAAMRGGREFLDGDYTFLMSRMSGDDSVPLESTGPDWQRFGAWSRRIPADGRMRFRLDDAFAEAAAGEEMLLKVTYFDSRSPRFVVDVSGAETQSFRGSATGTWKTIEMPLGRIDLSKNDGADITINASTNVTLHMVELVRSDLMAATPETARPKPPPDVW